MSEREKVVALTGHRELDDFDENELAYELERLTEEGYTAFLCGMAQGFDLLALKLLVALKQKKKLYLEACVPFEGHENSLSRATRERYLELLSACDRKTVLFPAYCAGCYLARDRYMVDCADLVLAHCEKETGGTAYTVNYAKKRGVPVRYI